MHRVIALASVLILVGCQDSSRVTDLEKRVSGLEQSVHQLEADQAKATDDESSKRIKLESCVADANTEFEVDMTHNGTRQRNGSYDVPVPVLEQMQRKKQSKIDECRLLYSK